MPTKKINLNLLDQSSRTEELIASFTAQAKSESWTDAEIKQVTDKALAAGYEQMVRTLESFCSTFQPTSDDHDEDAE